MKVLGLERKRAALQTKVDVCTRNAFLRAENMSDIRAQYACEHASLIQLEQSVATLVTDLKVTKVCHRPTSEAPRAHVSSTDLP